MRIIFFSETSKIKNIRIPKILFPFLLVFLFLLISSSILFVTQVVTDFVNYNDNRTLENENKILREELENFNSKLTYIENAIDEINNLDSKIRLLANIDTQDNSEVLQAGVGGIYEQKSSDLFFLNPEVESRRISTLEKIDELSRRLELEKYSFEYILEKIEQNKEYWTHIPILVPAKGYLTDAYGMRRHPITGKRRFHRGIDLGAPIGTPIISTADGVIEFVGWKGALGKTVDINHGYGFKTRYAHCHAILVKKGQKVKRGDVIAKIGNTGLSTSSHLHYEVRIANSNANPMNYIIGDIPVK